MISHVNSGVYVITNAIDGKRYIGSSVDLQLRKRTHWRRLRKGNHHSNPLQNAWNKYGEEAFTFDVLQIVDDAAQLLGLEQYYLNLCQPEYNTCPVARSCLGRKLTEEHRRKIGDGNRGKVHDAAFRAAVSERTRGLHVGRKHTSESRANMQAAQKIRVLSSEAWGRILAASHATKGMPKPKVGDALRGRTIPPDVRAKISNALRGRPRPPEVRAKIAAGHLSRRQKRNHEPMDMEQNQGAGASARV